MAQTTANADAILKNYYLGPVREQLNQRCVLMFNSDAPSTAETGGAGDLSTAAGEGRAWRGIARESEDVEFAGRQWVIPAHTSRNEGVGARAEGGTIPVAGQQGWTDLEDTLKHNLGSIELTRFAIRLSNRNEGAFLKLLEGEMKGLVNDLRKDVNRQGYGNSTGALAAVTADGSNTVTVDSVQYLRVGMWIDIIDSTDDSVDAQNRQITNIVASTKVVTYSGSDITASTDHRLCRTGSWKKEINGLGKLIGTSGTVHGVDSTQASNWWWVSKYRDANGGQFAEDTGQQLLDELDMTGISDGEVIITTHGIVRRYSNQLKQFKRFTDPVTLRGGFKALMFDESPMLKDPECPKGKMYFLDTDAFMWIYLPGGEGGNEPGNWDWVDDDGAILTRKADRTDGFEAYMAADHDLAIVKRSAVGYIDNLEDDAAGPWN